MSPETTVFYIYDTLCGWCNVARPEIRKLFNTLTGKIPTHAIHRRLFTGGYAPVVDTEFLKKVRRVGWEIAPKMTGQKFSEKYLALIQKTDFVMDSHLSSLGCAAAEILSDSEKAFQYAENLQSLVFDQGADPNQETYIMEAAKAVGLSECAMEKQLKKDETRTFALDKEKQAITLQDQSNTQGVPILLLCKKNQTLVKLDQYNASHSLKKIQASL